MRLTLEALHAKLLDLGTPRAQAMARVATDTGEVLIDRERAFTRSPLPRGRFVLVGSDGRRAWTVGPDGLQWIPSGDFAERRVSGREAIGGREAYVVAAIWRRGGRTEAVVCNRRWPSLATHILSSIAIGQEPTIRKRAG